MIGRVKRKARKSTQKQSHKIEYDHKFNLFLPIWHEISTHPQLKCFLVNEKRIQWQKGTNIKVINFRLHTAHCSLIWWNICQMTNFVNFCLNIRDFKSDSPLFAAKYQLAAFVDSVDWFVAAKKEICYWTIFTIQTNLHYKIKKELMNSFEIIKWTNKFLSRIFFVRLWWNSLQLCKQYWLLFWTWIHLYWKKFLKRGSNLSDC